MKLSLAPGPFPAGLVVLATIAALAPPCPLSAQSQGPQIGQPAPEFTLPDNLGHQHSLSDYRGQYVVLEWMNYGCPFVRKHYDAGNMQALQEKYGAMGVRWFSVVSSAPGNQGYYEPAEMTKMNEENGNKALAVLLDPSGAVGHSYRAQTTPHMFVINPDGILIYNGAIDDRPSARASSLEGAHNYVAAALDEAMSGKEVTLPLSKPYG